MLPYQLTLQNGVAFHSPEILCDAGSSSERGADSAADAVSSGGEGADGDGAASPQSSSLQASEDDGADEPAPVHNPQQRTRRGEDSSASPAPMPAQAAGRAPPRADAEVAGGSDPDDELQVSTGITCQSVLQA